MLSNFNNKSLFPIVSPEKAINYRWYNGSSNISSKVLPLSYQQFEELKKENNLIVPQIVNEGTILMRHPYLPNTLISINTSMADFLEEKLGYYAIILNYLGAKQQTLKARVISIQTRKFDGKGRFNIKGNKVEGKVNIVKKSLSRIKVSKVIEGTGKLDYERALSAAKEYGLEKDIFIKTMLELRHENPVPRYFSEFEIAQEYNDSMDVAASLAAAAGAFKLDGSFQKRVSSREEIRIIQDISFKDPEAKK